MCNFLLEQETNATNSIEKSKNTVVVVHVKITIVKNFPRMPRIVVNLPANTAVFYGKYGQFRGPNGTS